MTSGPLTTISATRVQNTTHMTKQRNSLEPVVNDQDRTRIKPAWNKWMFLFLERSQRKLTKYVYWFRYVCQRVTMRKLHEIRCWES